MVNVLLTYQPKALALLRITTGFLFLLHGIQKALGFYGGLPPSLPAHLVTISIIAGWIELVGSPLFMIGFFTRPVAFIMSGEMAVAYFVHVREQKALLPIENGGGQPYLFCFIFLYFACAGAGAWSLDNLFSKSLKATRG